MRQLGLFNRSTPPVRPGHVAAGDNACSGIVGEPLVPARLVRSGRNLQNLNFLCMRVSDHSCVLCLDHQIRLVARCRQLHVHVQDFLAAPPCPRRVSGSRICSRKFVRKRSVFWVFCTHASCMQAVSLCAALAIGPVGFRFHVHGELRYVVCPTT